MVGDGSFTMLMGEMATAVLYKLPVKVILFKNNLLAMDRFEQEEAGYPDFSIALQPIDFAAIAVACGAEGYTVTNPSALEATLRKALHSAGPAVVQVEVDPDEAPSAPEKLKVNE
jgi:thiamine pyrophosphate-dependent acetolactate synthase large subunit-like protein